MPVSIYFTFILILILDSIKICYFLYHFITNKPPDMFNHFTVIIFHTFYKFFIFFLYLFSIYSSFT